MVVACEKMTRGMLGTRVGGGGMGKGRMVESITANAISSRCTNVPETNQRLAFAVYRTVMVRMYPRV